MAMSSPPPWRRPTATIMAGQARPMPPVEGACLGAALVDRLLIPPSSSKHVLVSPLGSQLLQTTHAWPLGAASGAQLLLRPQEGC